MSTSHQAGAAAPSLCRFLRDQAELLSATACNPAALVHWLTNPGIPATLLGVAFQLEHESAFQSLLYERSGKVPNAELATACEKLGDAIEEFMCKFTAGPVEGEGASHGA